MVRLERQAIDARIRDHAHPAADGITYATIDLTEAEYRSFYVNFSNGALWPLLHFRLGLLDFHREDYDGYRRRQPPVSPTRCCRCCARTT